MPNPLGLYRTTVGKKIVMALTGLVLVGFLVSHVLSNLLIFRDPEALDRYAAWLRSLGPWLWVARGGLLLAAVLHVTAAYQLTIADRAARPVAYARLAAQASSWGARTMRAGGVLLLGFIVYHLLHFTFGTVHPDFEAGRVGRNVITGLAGHPAVAGFYLLAMTSLGLHLSHGVWSFFQTMGLNHPSWNAARRVVAWAAAVAVAGGFFLIPLAALLGWLRL